MQDNTEYLLQLKEVYDDAYYNSGTPLVTDKDYDCIVDELKKRGIKLGVGTEINVSKDKIKLPYWLGSLDKIKPENTSLLSKWLNIYKAESYIIASKLDGVSALYEYNEGKRKLYTRGNGEIGQDISCLLRYIDINYNNIPDINTYYIRGELVMKKSDFEKYKNTYSNARNMVSGLVNSKTINYKTLHNELKDIYFLAYEFIYPNIHTKYSEDLEFMSNYGDTVKWCEITNLDMNSLVAMLHYFKNTEEYNIDGLVVQPNKNYNRNIKGNPKYAFAFKTNEESILATVENVEWNISMHSTYKPRIKIKPVNLSDVTITYTTGFNGKYIYENNIGPGTVLELIRSGGVIPHIVNIVKSTKAQMPENYTWGENGVDIYNLNSTNENLKIKQLTHFFTTMQVKNVSLCTITKLYINGYNTILKILSAKKNDFLKIDTFQEKSADRLYTSIHEKMKNVPLYRLMAASCIFGFGLGEKKFRLLTDKFPDLIYTYNNTDPIEFKNSLLHIEGFSTCTANKIIVGMSWFINFYNNISPYISLSSSSTSSIESKSKFKCVFSGFRDQCLKKYIEKMGGEVISNVTKNTDYVITDSEDVSTNKTKDALRLNIPIYTQEKFIDFLKLK